MIVLIGIILTVYVFVFAMIRSAGMADRRLEEIQMRSAAGEAGASHGN